MDLNKKRRNRDLAQQAAVTVSVAALLIILLLFLWYSVGVLLLTFAGLLLAIFLRGLSDPLSKHSPLSAGWSLAVVVLALTAIIGVSTWLLAPRIATQIDLLTKTLPQSLERLQNYVQQYQWTRGLLDQAPSFNTFITSSVNTLGRITGVLSGTLNVLANAVIVLSIGLYLAVNPGLYTRGLIQLAPVDKRERAQEVLYALKETLQWWLIARVISMAAVGVLTALGLWAIGVPLALTLGLLAALLTFIPYIGPIVAAVPALLLAFLQGPTLMLYVMLLYISVQTIENYLVTPLVQQRAVSLPPALTVFALTLLGVLLGLMGLILATPLAAAALVLVKMLYIEDTLGAPVDGSTHGSGISNSQRQ